MPDPESHTAYMMGMVAPPASATGAIQANSVAFLASLNMPKVSSSTTRESPSVGNSKSAFRQSGGMMAAMRLRTSPVCGSLVDSQRAHCFVAYRSMTSTKCLPTVLFLRKKRAVFFVKVFSVSAVT